MINLGNKIRELRKRKGITQEQLANALNVSSQAVSKWEMGTGYPDICFVPVIAGYFQVTLDELFDYDVKSMEERIDEIAFRGNRARFEEAEKELLDAIALYPGSDKLKGVLLSQYERRIRRGDHMDLCDRAIELGERLLGQTNDFFIVTGAQADMASIYMVSGLKDKAKSIIESMPYVYNLNICDRMRTAASTLEGEDRLKGAREWKAWAHQDLHMCCWYEGRGFLEIGDYENALRSFREAIEVNQLFAEREKDEGYYVEEYRMIGDNTVYYTVWCAACYYKMGKLDLCDATLEQAYRYLKDHCDPEHFRQHPNWVLASYRQAYCESGLDAYKSCI